LRSRGRDVFSSSYACLPIKAEVRIEEGNMKKQGRQYQKEKPQLFLL
jgi:hypothetical protein